MEKRATAGVTARRTIPAGRPSGLASRPGPLVRRSGAVGAVLVAVVALSSGSTRAAGGPAPTEDPEAFLAAPTALVADTVGNVVAILQDGSLPTDERRRRIEKLAFEVFDFPTMGKLVLARNWKKFDASQRREFIAEFRVHLSRNYGSRLDRYRQTDVEITGARIEPRNDVTVHSKVVGGEFDGVGLDYRLRERDGEWKVIDVVIEGVSLIANFRSQFREVVSQKGPDGLLDQMRAKNAEPRTEEEAGA